VMLAFYCRLFRWDSNGIRFIVDIYPTGSYKERVRTYLAE